MEYLNTYKILDEEIVYASLNNRFLTILPDGKTGAWLKKTDRGFIWVGDYNVGFDLFEKFPNIRSSILVDSLSISFDKKMFLVELCTQKRVGGYKEPCENCCLNFARGHSVYEALRLLNLKIQKQEFTSTVPSDFKSTIKNTVVGLEEYKRHRSLIKERI